jgi:beta-lactamase regulating signal transducer with metallopeptidase domain
MKGEVFFNLLANSSFSLLAGFVIVLFFIWLFRVDTGPWKLFFLSLPFFKIVFDCIRGLPADSVLYAGIDPYVLPPKHQIFSMSAELTKWGPQFLVAFSVVDSKGKEYAASIGDYLAIWLNRKFSPEVPVMIVTAVCAVAVTLLVLRLIHAFRFEGKRRADRAFASSLRIIGVWKRSVDIYISDSFSGTPFTGGILAPYICIPRDAYEKLNSQEMEAVISHEMGHICQFDLPFTVFIQLLGDLFWFIPGYRALSRKIDRLREIVADQWVIRSGQNPVVLASALVKLKEIPEASERFVLYSAFFREKSLLKTRVERLLGKICEGRGRFGWQNHWFRYFVSLWIFAAVMLGTVGGNQNAHGKEGLEMFDSLLRFFGVR